MLRRVDLFKLRPAQPKNLPEPGPDDLDLNEPVDNDVFLPGPRSPGADKAYRLMPGDPGYPEKSERKTCCPFKFRRHLPRYYGYPNPASEYELGSHRVKELTEESISCFLRDTTNCLVMFFKSIDGEMPPEIKFYGKRLAEAARTTKKGPYGYGIVDCVKETDLCATIRDLPMNRHLEYFPFFNLFNNEEAIMAIKNENIEHFDAYVMRALVEEFHRSQLRPTD